MELPLTDNVGSTDQYWKFFVYRFKTGSFGFSIASLEPILIKPIFDTKLKPFKHAIRT